MHSSSVSCQNTIFDIIVVVVVVSTVNSLETNLTMLGIVAVVVYQSGVAGPLPNLF